MSAFSEIFSLSFKLEILHSLDENHSAASFIFPLNMHASTHSLLEGSQEFLPSLQEKTALSITFFKSLTEKVSAPVKPPLSDFLEIDSEAQFLVSTEERCSYLFLRASFAKLQHVKISLESLGLREEKMGDGGTGGTIPVAGL